MEINEARQDVQAKLLGAPSAPAAGGGGGVKTSNSSLPRSPRQGELVLSVGCGWGQVQGSGWRGGFDALPTPSVALCTGCMCNIPVLLPAFQKWQLGFWSFCVLSIIHPNCTYTLLFLLPYSFFVFCCSRRHLSRCKHCKKGPQVPARLTLNMVLFETLFSIPLGILARSGKTGSHSCTTLATCL